MSKVNWRWQLLTPIFALLLVLADQSDGLFNRLEFRVQDDLLYAAASRRPAPDQIIQVRVDARDLDAMRPVAGDYPWPRSVFAEVLEGVEAAGARAVVFDMFFNEADTFRADSDALFRDSVARHDNVYVPVLLLHEGHGASLYRLQHLAPGLHIQGELPDAYAPFLLPLVLKPTSWRGGLVNILRDRDGVGRRYLLNDQLGHWQFPSMVLRVAQDLGWSFPARTTMVMDWYKPDWPQLSFADVYHTVDQHQPLPNMQGKIVVFGITAPGLENAHPTPMLQADPSLNILSTALANLLKDDWLHVWPARPWIAVLMVLALLTAIGLGLSSTKIFLGMMACSCLMGFSAYLLLLHAHVLVVGLSGLGIAWSIFFVHLLMSNLQHRNLHRQFEIRLQRFMDPHRVSVLAARSVDDVLRPRYAQVCILVAMLEWEWSENVAATRALEVCNGVLRRLTGVVFSLGGTIVSLDGAELSAAWNVPEESMDVECRALDAALTMHEVMKVVREEFGMSSAKLHVAVHSGRALAGMVGTEWRQDYSLGGLLLQQVRRMAFQAGGAVVVSETLRQACQVDYDFVPVVTADTVGLFKVEMPVRSHVRVKRGVQST